MRRIVVPRTIESSTKTTFFPLTTPRTADSFIRTPLVGVPNSSLSAASGYAEEAQIPYELGLVKNQYVARTFIQPATGLSIAKFFPILLRAVCTLTPAIFESGRAK
jgi:hypothetical protein